MAVLLRKVFDPYLGEYLPFGVLLLAVALVAWRGGLGPALVTVIAGYLATAFLFMPPRNSFAITGFMGWANTLVYFAISGGLVWTAMAQRAAQRHAQESQEQLSAMLQNTGAVVFFMSCDGHILHVNRRCEELLHLKNEEVRGKSMYEVVPRETAAVYDANNQRVVADRVALEFEEAVPLPDGLHIYKSNKSPVFDATGKVRGIVGVSTDITEQKRADEALQQSERRYRRLFETMTEGLAFHELICDPEGKPSDIRYLQVNPGFELQTGMKAADVVGHTVLELFPQAERGWFERCVQVALTGESAHFEAWFGSLGRCFEVRAFQTRPGRFAAMFFDITERKRTEVELQFKACALAQISEAVTAFDMNGRLTYWNPAARQMYGYTEQEAMGRTPEDLFQYQWLGGQNLPMALDALTKQGFWRSENIHTGKSGEALLVESSTSLLRNDRGETTSYLSVLRNITERRRTEQAITRHGQRLELLSQTAAHLLLGDDPPAVIETIFQKLQEQVQVDIYFNFLVNESGDALGLHSFAGVSNEVAQDISHLEFGQAICGTAAAQRRPLVCNHIQQSEEPSVQLVKGLGVRAYACHPLLVDGRLLGTLSVGSRTKDEFLQEELELFQTLSRYIALALDRWRLLTEATQRAEELERRVAERTARLEESLSSLKGVLYHVAHDLRAPLRAMHSFTQLLVENYAHNLDATGEQYTQIISGASKKMDVLIGDLLNVGQLGHRPVSWMTVDLTALVGSVVAALDGKRDGQPAEIQVAQPLPKVWGDPQIIEQVLVNLLSNSLKFVAPNTAPRIRLWAETCGQTVRLNLQDNGIGISPEYQERIFGVFERLHTDAYPGTGIGLAIVKKGMERLQGRVGVESKPGVGSRFWLELQRAAYE